MVEAEPHRPGPSAGASCPRRAPRSLPRVGRNHEKVAPSRQRQFVQWPQTLRGCHLPRGEFLAAKGSPGGQRQHSRCVLAEDLPLRQSAARSGLRASAKALCRPNAAISFADRALKADLVTPAGQQLRCLPRGRGMPGTSRCRGLRGPAAARAMGNWRQSCRSLPARPFADKVIAVFRAVGVVAGRSQRSPKGYGVETTHHRRRVAGRRGGDAGRLQLAPRTLVAAGDDRAAAAACDDPRSVPGSGFRPRHRRWASARVSATASGTGPQPDLRR